MEITDEVVNSIPVQEAISYYLRDLGPVLNHGRYYLHRIVRFYLRSGCTATTRELLELTGKQYDRTPNNIAGRVGYFVKDVFRREDAVYYCKHWRELGWDGKTPLTPSKVIPLVCKGLYPYMMYHYPSMYCQLVRACPPPEDALK